MEGPTKGSRGGRVRYLDFEFSGIGAEEMRSAGELVADAFPTWRVEVTAGPYRFCNVSYRMNLKSRTICLDFYSVRPELDSLPELIQEMQQKIVDFLGDIR